MVSPKAPKTGTGDWLKDELDRVRKRMGEVIDHRWYVMEVTPAWDDDGYWGHKHYPAEYKIVSPYLKTKPAAEKWKDDHVADKGKTLQLGHDKKYRRVVEEWH